jgi:hypothetical protein
MLELDLLPPEGDLLEALSPEFKPQSHLKKKKKNKRKNILNKHYIFAKNAPRTPSTTIT